MVLSEISQNRSPKMDQRTGIKRERERNVDIIQAPVEGVPEKRARNSQEQYGTIQLAASALRYSEPQVFFKYSMNFCIT